MAVDTAEIIHAGEDVIHGSVEDARRRCDECKTSLLAGIQHHLAHPQEPLSLEDLQAAVGELLWLRIAKNQGRATLLFCARAVSFLGDLIACLQLASWPKHTPMPPSFFELLPRRAGTWARLRH
jgi:hypothetical protein